MLDNNDLCVCIEAIKEKIFELKKTITDLEDIYLFEVACGILDFHLEKYFREDISILCMYSCQIILNHYYLKPGMGTTYENAYENALYLNFKKAKSNEFLVLTEIKENLLNIDVCNSFIDHCQKYFNKQRPNNNYYNMKEYIKRETGSQMAISEQIRDVGKGKYLCSIFLNDNLLLQQGSVIDYDKDNPMKAMENTTKEFLNSYSICSTEIKPNKSHSTVKDILEEVHFYLKNKTGITSYFSAIKSFADERQYPMKIYFCKGVSTIEINNLKIARGEHEDEYCSYIVLCKALLEKINQCQRNISINRKQRLSSSTSSVAEQNSPTKAAKKNVTAILKEIALHARNERKSNELTSYWSILTRLFKNSELHVEPLYKRDQGSFVCSLMLHNKEIAQSVETNKTKSREAAAKVFIDYHLSKNHAK